MFALKGDWYEHLCWEESIYIASGQGWGSRVVSDLLFVVLLLAVVSVSYTLVFYLTVIQSSTLYKEGQGPAMHWVILWWIDIAIVPYYNTILILKGKQIECSS